MNLNQPYYIEPRTGDRHIELDGTWEYLGTGEPLASAETAVFAGKGTIPNSLFHFLHEAEGRPDPYIGTGSKAYGDVDEKVWYFRKTFTLRAPAFAGNAILCFDGVAYYCRIWMNGHLLGEHEGMYGGPCTDVTEFLTFDGENVLTVEVRSCNYGQKQGYDYNNQKGTLREIQPWNLIRDRHTSNGDFLVAGIWNRVRLELLDRHHISRPYLVTERADGEAAELHLSCEITDGSVQELKPFYGYQEGCYTYTRAYDSGLTGAVRNEGCRMRIRISEKGSGISVFDETEDVRFTDYEKLYMDRRFYELQFYEKDIRIGKPRLWYPNGMGDAFLYRVEIIMYAEDGDTVYDEQSFDFGIRTFEAKRTAGPRYRTRWNDFLFSVNGRETFLKGINWMPVDYLYRLDPKEYEWNLTLAKNAGIQLVRVWSGGGMPETDAFYQLCDRLGIMVWQDHMIANTPDTHSYPQDVLEAQEAYNLYRMRCHPSLVLHCGGNEFNPYSTGNAASMFVISRVIGDLDPARIYHYTTADRGSAHIYRDMEPVWYRYLYRDLPFLAESGIHSFPSYRSLKRLLRKEETEGTLTDIASPDFREKYPELLNHFTEYAPSRVPRMLARASQIADLSHITLEGMCEATQLQAYEFYLLMIQALRENYPRTGGVIPWVFRRHWPTVGIQVVDGLGQPGLPYYALKNAYQPVGISFCQPWTVIKPGETLPMELHLFDQNDVGIDGCEARLTVYAPDWTPVFLQKAEVKDGSRHMTFGTFTPDERFTNSCFIACAELVKDGMLLARSNYVFKCTDMLCDETQYRKNRSPAAENLRFDRGPWFRTCMEQAPHTVLSAENCGTGTNGGYRYADIRVENKGSVPAFPVTFDLGNENGRFFADENVLLLKPGERRTVRITCDGLAEQEDPVFLIKAMNAETVTVQ